MPYSGIKHIRLYPRRTQTPTAGLALWAAMITIVASSALWLHEISKVFTRVDAARQVLRHNRPVNTGQCPRAKERS